MKKILFAKPSITQKEIDYVNDAVKNGWGLNCYDYLNRFTDKLKNYFNSPYVWPTSSCHGALHIVLTDANRVQMATLIEDSKNTCKSLGFQQGTDKFTDCTLKLYSQKLDLVKEQNQQVVVQNQGSSTVRVIDVTRERETTMRRSMGLINGTCTLATYYSC